MDIKTFVEMAKALPPNQSILLRARHGCGKSQVVRFLAAHYKKELESKYPELKDLPVSNRDKGCEGKSFLIDRRLAQMSEGDVIGLPELVDASTRFCPPTWFIDACNNPRILFLDEINRATPEVMQAAFQIVLDYELNGWKLHPDTRVFAAINPDQGAYVVNAMDPALLDRFAVVDLDPSLDDFYDWAKDKLGKHMYDFLRNNPGHVEHTAVIEPGKVYPSRRSWELLDNMHKHANLSDTVYERNQVFYSMALSRVGVEAAIAFQDYVCTLERNITAEDILDRYDEVKAKIGKLGPEKWNILAEKIHDHAKANVWTEPQLDNLGAYMRSLPGEHMVATWNGIATATGDDVSNIKNIHPRIIDALLPNFQKTEEKKEDKAEPAAAKPKKAKKGK